jgi:putative membrane protein
MRTRRLRIAALAIIGTGGAAPLWAVSLSNLSSTQSEPRMNINPAAAAVDNWTAAGSASLVPLMASEAQANQSNAYQISTADTAASGGEPVVGKPMNAIAFARAATKSGRREVESARNALPQLKAPELKRIAAMLVSDHNAADARLSRIAAAKQWPVPGPSAPAAPPSGSASGDFDAKWTVEMIDGHEREIALYRAQAAAGEDKDLRQYARDTLPTLEQHLAQLKSLQK